MIEDAVRVRLRDPYRPLVTVRRRAEPYVPPRPAQPAFFCVVCGREYSELAPCVTVQDLHRRRGPVHGHVPPVCGYCCRGYIAGLARRQQPPLLRLKVLIDALEREARAQ